MLTVRDAISADVEAITRIYNLGIASGTGTLDTHAREPAEIAAWLDKAARYPVLVIEQAGEVAGFARLFEYRPRACYASIAEYSIYLHPESQGKGFGSTLLAALIERAKALKFTKLVSRIFTFNHASRALCQKLGFREVGVYEAHGQLNGQWLDVVIVEYLIRENL